MEKSDSNIGLFFAPIHALTRAKDERRFSEGKSASWHSRVCEARAARPPQFKFQNPKIKNQKFFWKLKKKLYLCPKLTLQ